MKALKHKLTIKPTNDCNMRCKHCYHFGTLYDRLKLPINKVKKIIDIWSTGCSELEILWHGGEPTLMGVDYYKEVFEYQKNHTDENNVKFTNIFQTNGLLINEEWCKFFHENNVCVGISFDGPYNDRLRTNTKEVYENIKLLKQNNVTYVVLCVVTSDTIGSLQEIYNWFNSKKIDFKIIPISKDGMPCEISHLILEPDTYIENMVNTFKTWLFDVNCNIVVPTFESMFFGLFDLKSNRVNSELPYCIQTRIGIDSRGDIYPCGKFYSKECVITNVDLVDKIADLYAAKSACEIYEKVEKHRAHCSLVCEYADICNGGCIVTKINEGSLCMHDSNSCKILCSLYDGVKPYVQQFKEDFKANQLGKYNPLVVSAVKKSEKGNKNGK